MRHDTARRVWSRGGAETAVPRRRIPAAGHSARRLLGAERVDGCRVEGLSCPQDGGREVGLVRRVREVLGLERVTRGLPVGMAADADQVAVKEVAGVELDTRLI